MLVLQFLRRDAGVIMGIKDLDIEAAMQAVVHATDGMSAQQIAEKMGISYQLLAKKVNPDEPCHILTLQESILIQQVTGNYAILYVMAKRLGKTCVTAH